MEMILTGAQLGAAEALACGLVSRVYPHYELMSRARSMASTIASMGQFAVRMALKAVNMTEEIPLSDG